MRHRLGWRVAATLALAVAAAAAAQTVDRTLAPNTLQEGIAKTLAEQAGAGRGDWATPYSSSYIIHRDPFRAIRRGRQLFQRKFTFADGAGPLTGDGRGDLDRTLALGAGLADSCAACHGRPRGSAGAGGVVATRPDSRDAPHLFGVGLKEMLADEITADLRAIRAQALADARASGVPVRRALASKGIAYGSLLAHPDGRVDASRVEGVDADLRVRPFFAHGGKFSLREFIVGALNDEMGLQAADPDLAAASAGGRVVSPSGLVLDGALDAIVAPPAASPADDPDRDGLANEVPESLVDFLEFYLLNYFKPATYRSTQATERGRAHLQRIGCTSCHVADLPLREDRRVADVETRYDPQRGHFNGLFATAVPLFEEVDDRSGHPPLRQAKRGAFVVRDFYSDLKRHDLGPAFHERDYDGTIRPEFVTAPLWGVATTAPYGHDGRSINLREVILRHGGEAQRARDAFARLPEVQKGEILDFLATLVLFPPDDTASNLNPGDRGAAGYPQYGHGSIRLPALFNDPSDPE